MAMSGACSLSLLSDRVYNTIDDTKEKVKHVGLLHRISSCFTKSSFTSCSCDERGRAIDEGARQILEALEEAGKEGGKYKGYHITRGQRPQPFLENAKISNREQIELIIRGEK